MKILLQHTLFIIVFSGLLFISCSKSNKDSEIPINPVEVPKQLSVIVLMGDGMGISQITAAWHQNKFLHLQRFPYSGLVLTHTANSFVPESGSACTSLMSGYKTNYGFLGLDANLVVHESLLSYSKSKNYLTGIITTSFISDATLAALYAHQSDRYLHEEIALEFYHHYPDFTIAGGQNHFNQRQDGKNLLDSLQTKGVQLVYSADEIQQISQLPAIGFMSPLRPPYISDGRSDFLYKGSQKALDLFNKQAFFLFIEGALIDKGGHDNSIEDQLAETLEFDQVVGMVLDYAENRGDVLLVVISDHESGGLTLLQGNGYEYIPNYSTNSHSGEMVTVFAYGPGAEQFTGIMDNTEIYNKLKKSIDNSLNN